jgi:hypothetical protein
VEPEDDEDELEDDEWWDAVEAGNIDDRGNINKNSQLLRYRMLAVFFLLVRSFVVCVPVFILSFSSFFFFRSFRSEQC